MLKIKGIRFGTLYWFIYIILLYKTQGIHRKVSNWNCSHCLKYNLDDMKCSKKYWQSGRQMVLKGSSQHVCHINASHKAKYLIWPAQSLCTRCRYGQNPHPVTIQCSIQASLHSPFALSHLSTFQLSTPYLSKCRMMMPSSSSTVPIATVCSLYLSAPLYMMSVERSWGPPPTKVWAICSCQDPSGLQVTQRTWWCPGLEGTWQYP